MAPSPIRKNALTFIQGVLDKGITGSGPFKSAHQIAEEALKYSHGDTEKAIKRVIRNHSAIVTTTGFATGFGGLPLQIVAMPTDLTTSYIYAVRMVGAIAILRGYDADSEEVRVAISVSLIGAFGSESLAKMGIKIGNNVARVALKKLPARTLHAINKKVGFRLLTKFGETGVFNLGKGIPLVGAGVGASMNAVSIRAIAGYALHNFPVFDPAMVEEPEDVVIIDDDNDDDGIVDAEIIED